MPISSALGSSALLPAGLGFRNKIINGDMRIAQRGTSAITASGAAQYPVDRWIASSGTTNSITFQQVADAPSGFTHSVRATSGATGSAYTASHYTFLTQRIEGFNCSDLAWGTASAKPITISFWVKVSANAVGTHSVAVENVAGTMNYVATYTVSSTSWEYKTIQINGPTSGTFATDNTTGFQINFTLGAGSNYDTTAGTWTSGKYSVSGAVDLGALSSATWQVTGVQLEQNYQPTPFEQRPIGVELQLCQRYFERIDDAKFGNMMTGYSGWNGAVYVAVMKMRTTQRMRGTVAVSASTNGSVYNTANQTMYTVGSWAFFVQGDQGFQANSNVAVASANGNVMQGGGFVFDVSAEL